MGQKMLHYYGTENVTLTWDKKCHIIMGQKMVCYHGTENVTLNYQRTRSTIRGVLKYFLAT